MFGMHQVEKASTTEIGLRTVQHINKKWKDSGETFSNKECGPKIYKLMNDLLKSNILLESVSLT